MKVTVYVDQAIAVLQQNREKHVEEYKLQLYGWKQEMSEYGKKMQEWANKPEDKRPVEPYKPSSYVKDYDRLIVKLTYHNECSQRIELDDREYSMIFENQFQWLGSFRGTSTVYNTSITADKISAGVLSAVELDIE